MDIVSESETPRAREDRTGCWVEQMLDPDWVALYRFAWQDGGPVLAEVHVVPQEAPGGFLGRDTPRGWDAPPGSWRHFLSGTFGHLGRLPRGGLSARSLRRLKPRNALGDWFMDAREAILLGLHDHPGWKGASERMWQRHQERLGLAEPSEQRPEPRPLRLARIARLYSDGVAAGRGRLDVEIGQLLHRKPEHIRDDIHAARREGLLTEGPGRGRSGGTLTSKARGLLDDEANERRNRRPWLTDAERRRGEAVRNMLANGVIGPS